MGSKLFMRISITCVSIVMITLTVMVVVLTYALITSVFR